MCDLKASRFHIWKEGSGDNLWDMCLVHGPLTSPVLRQGLPAPQFLGSPQRCTRLSPEARALKVFREPPSALSGGWRALNFRTHKPPAPFITLTRVKNNRLISLN